MFLGQSVEILSVSACKNNQAHLSQPCRLNADVHNIANSFACARSIVWNVAQVCIIYEGTNRCVIVMRYL